MRRFLPLFYCTFSDTETQGLYVRRSDHGTQEKSIGMPENKLPPDHQAIPVIVPGLGDLDEGDRPGGSKRRDCQCCF
jgi:hypothetical protein